MKTLACGTKQFKTVIAKENLKKPKQTQKKTSEQLDFVGLWVWYFLESQNLTVLRGISENGRKGRKMLQVGLCGSVLRLWVRKLAGRYTMMMTDMSSYPVESSKGKQQDDDTNSWMMAGRG